MPRGTRHRSGETYEFFFKKTLLFRCENMKIINIKTYYNYCFCVKDLIEPEEEYAEEEYDDIIVTRGVKGKLRFPFDFSTLIHSWLFWGA